MKCSMTKALQSFPFRFQCIGHVLTTHIYYPSLSKLWKTFKKVLRKSRFAIVRKTLLLSKRCTPSPQVKFTEACIILICNSSFDNIVSFAAFQL